MIELIERVSTTENLFKEAVNNDPKQTSDMFDSPGAPTGGC